MMDSELTFKSHYDYIIRKAFKNLGFINRVTKPFNSTDTLKILYFSFVRSILDFGCNVWSPYYQDDINNIEKVQKKFINILNYRNNVSNLSYDDSLKRYKMLSLQNRRTQFDISLLHKIINSLIDCPTLLSKINFITKARLPVRSSRRLDILVPPRLRKNYTCNNFFYRCLVNYNKNYADVDIFSNSLKSTKNIVFNKLL